MEKISDGAFGMQGFSQKIKRSSAGSNVPSKSRFTVGDLLPSREIPQILPTIDFYAPLVYLIEFALKIDFRLGIEEESAMSLRN